MRLHKANYSEYRKGSNTVFKGKKRKLWTDTFHFAPTAQFDEYTEDVCRVSVLRIASFPVTSISIHPKDNIQIQADLEDQAQERRNLEGDISSLNSKWQHPLLHSLARLS